MKRELAVDSIDVVELRIERRRQQLRRDWDETRAYLARQNRWTPLAVVAGVAALGFGLARRRRPTSAERVVGRRGAFAAMAAMISGGIRFVLSPAGRSLWSAWRRGPRDAR